MYIFFNLIFEILIFENCILNIWSKFTYFDEILLLILIVLNIFIIINKKSYKFVVNKKKITIFILSISLFVLGIFLAFYSGIQPNKGAIFKGGLNYIKIFITFLLIENLSKYLDKDRLLSSISKRARVYIDIMFAFMIYNLLINNQIFNIGEYRYGIREYAFLFSHPTYMVASVAMLLAVVKASQLKNKKRLIVQCIIIIGSSLKSKAFLFIIFFIIINLFLKYRNKIKFTHIITAGIIGSLAVYEKALHYLSYGYSAARSALILIGLDLSIKYFPFGIGFSAFSGKYYTSLYSMYNVHNIQGLSADYYNYAGDMFWPVLLGEVGYVGISLYIVCLVLSFKLILNKYKRRRESYISCIYLIGYLLIASAVESILGDVPSMMFFIIMSIYLGNDKNNSEK